MLKRLIPAILILFFVLGFFDFAFAQPDKAEIHFFYSPTCPFCLKEKEFLKELKEKYPEIEIKEFEITKIPENQEILAEFYKKYNVPKKEQGWVPVTFTSTKYFVGFNENVKKDILGCIMECLGNCLEP